MKRRKGNDNRILAIILTVMLISSLMVPCGLATLWRANADEAGEGEKGMAAYVNTAPGANVRVAPGSSSDSVKDRRGFSIQLPASTIVHILEKVEYKSGSETTEWAKIRFDYNGEKDLTGYVMTKFLLEFNEVTVDAEFEAAMDAQGFPESYRKILRAVHQWNPTWTFQAEILDLDWNTAVNAEYAKWPTITNNNGDYPSSWKSHDMSDYNYAVDDGNGGLKDGNWVLKDGRYARASKQMLAYSMDPRNFLAECTIFMFEDLDYNPNVQTITGVERILSKYDPTKNSRGTFAQEVEGTTHAALFMEAAQQSGVNPYFLATRSVHEVNNSDIMRGNGVKVTVNGEEVTKYVGIYNYYNFGSYAADGMGVIEHGLWFAATAQSAATIQSQGYDDLRPWDTRAKAIIGGALRLGNEYVLMGQNTPYYQRYNVAPKKNPNNGKIYERYGHQYMSLVTALYQESTMYYSGLLDDAATGTDAASAIETPFTFIIPVYKNMPETPCERPTGDGNPNPYLASLTIEGVELSPAFSWKTLEYKFTVEADVATLNLVATPLARTTQIQGAGEIKLLYGENEYTIKCKAQDGTIVRYKLTIMRKGDGENPSVTPTPIDDDDWVSPTPTPAAAATATPVPATPTPTPEQETITSETFRVTDKQICNVAPGTDVKTFLAGITASGGSASLLNAKGEAVNEGTVGTGWTLKTATKTIPVIIYGDVNGDGVITALDLLYVKRHILGISTLSGVTATAAAVKSEGTIAAIDLLYIKRHILGISEISQAR
ncbi:MAG: cadherin-like beta sandwich domain-containing protein [Lachnospiraceae bacterium]|nr:cadherin-like beta sandwich domain-containing protein [Lachnospiraceae bacterium]